MTIDRNRAARFAVPEISVFPPTPIYIGAGKTVENQGVFPQENAWKICNAVIFRVFPHFQVDSCFPARKNPFFQP